MSEILRKRFLAHVGQTSPSPMMIEVARAEGVFFHTPEGKRYYDLVSGVSVNNVGHANRRGGGRATSGGGLHARDGLRRAGRTSAGGVRASPFRGVARAVGERIFRQLGRRGGRGGVETRQTLHRPHRDDLHASRLPRLHPRGDEHDGRARGRGVEGRSVLCCPTRGPYGSIARRIWRS